jgi:hypothetical protein
MLGAQRIFFSMDDLYEVQAYHEEECDERDPAGENSEPEAERASHTL